ncbi:MAG: hypothetical protein ACI9OO_000070 [Bacteroidia bacterium]|jgi:hypothetical protein
MAGLPSGERYSRIRLPALGHLPNENLHDTVEGSCQLLELLALTRLDLLQLLLGAFLGPSKFAE